MFTVGDMFSGVGGIASGFMDAGFEIMWSNEFDSNACATYRANFPTHDLIECDVNTIDTRTLNKVDVITAGFPCQAFSLAGYRKGFDDHRGNLFFEVVRFIDSLRPKAFLLENVRNLQSHDKGRTFKVIQNCVEDGLGYSFIYFVMSGHTHGNVPQHRERVYMVGFRDEHGQKNKINYADLFISNKNSLTYLFEVPSEIKLTKKVSDIIDWSKQDNKYYFSKGHKYIPQLESSIKCSDTLYQWRRTYVRENKNNLCPTLTANMGCGGHNVPLLRDGWGFRKLTPIECFKFQGFKDSFVIPDGVSDFQLYKQAGNSVVVPVIARIAIEIKRVLENIG